MPVVKHVIAEGYKIVLLPWEGVKASEVFWFDPKLKADTVVNRLNCYLRLVKYEFLPFGWEYLKVEREPCEESPEVSNKFELNGKIVFDKPAHVTLDRFEDGKKYLATERNTVRAIIYKTAWLNPHAYRLWFDIWIEIDYSGGAPEPTLIPSRTPEPPDAEEPLPQPVYTPNPAFPYSGMPFMGEFSSLFLLVIVVMIFVLIITAIRRS
jgi:hypothetical protein